MKWYSHSETFLWISNGIGTAIDSMLSKESRIENCVCFIIPVLKIYFFSLKKGYTGIYKMLTVLISVW